MRASISEGKEIKTLMARHKAKEEINSRERDNAVQHSYPDPNLSDVRDLCDAWNDQSVKRP